MSKQQRRQISAEEKVKILRLHLLEGKAVSVLCEEHGVQPSLFYTWQKQFFENGTGAFNGGPAGCAKPNERLLVEFDARPTPVSSRSTILAELSVFMK